jgi:putative N6-adenine-specific DNA methylase
MADFQATSTISVSCPKQLAPYLKKEVEALGFSPESMRETGLDLRGSLEDCLTLNLCLRTAHRVHFLISEAKIDTPDALYAWLKALPWEDWIPPKSYFSVTSRVEHPTINNTQFANLRCKDAIVDRFREVDGNRPDTGPDTTKSVVFLYWDKNQARIFMDTSGESLSRRGYRVANTEAPMQESLGAALVMATGWDPASGQAFINPMCGSGTLAIEAATLMMGYEPAARRRNFGFMHIAGFDRKLYKQKRLELRKNRKETPPARIIATDYDTKVIQAAQENAAAAGVDQFIEFKRCDFTKTPLPEGDGIILMNPPYGERLGDKDLLIETYEDIGDWFKQKGTGKTGFVFTGDAGLSKRVGLRAARKEAFYNTTLPCQLLEYELY